MEELKVFLRDKKNRYTLGILLVLVLSLFIGIALVRTRQIFFPKATGAPIELAEGGCIITHNGVKAVNCPLVPIRLNAPFGPPNFSTPSASVTPTPGASAVPSSDPSVSPTPGASASPASSATPTPLPSIGDSPLPSASVAVTDTEPIYRLNNPVSDDHLYTADAGERARVLAIPNGRWQDEGVGFKAYATQVTGTVPVYRMFNNPGGHFYTSNVDEKNASVGSGAWADEGVAFYAFPSATAGTSLVHRLARSGNRHFYTISDTEFNNVISGGIWSAQDYGLFYAFPPDTAAGTFGTQTLLKTVQSIAQNIGGYFLKDAKAQDNGGNSGSNDGGNSDQDNNDACGAGNPNSVGQCSSPTPTPAPAQATGTISANPTTCTVNSSGVCDPVTITWSTANASDVCIYISSGSVVRGTLFQSGPSGSSQASSLTPGAYLFTLFANCNSNATPLGSTLVTALASNPSPSSTPTTARYTIAYSLAENQQDLDNSLINLYTEDPLVTNFKLSDINPGTKQIWVRFFDNLGNTEDDHITFDLLSPDPIATGVDCTVGIAKSTLKVTLNGKYFGTTNGTMKANDSALSILDWNDNQAVGELDNSGTDIPDGQTYTIKMTRADGVSIPDQICKVNTSILSLGAKVFCRDIGGFAQTNVKVDLVDTLKNKVEETVSIDKDGIVQGLQTKLQAGKRYVVGIKAPYSIRRNAEFTAAQGTTVVTAEDGNPFILPIGDIAPRIQQDGKINTADRSELTTQWRVLGTSKTVQTGDFNKDTKVNSIDWACMRYDFNAEDDPIPTLVPDADDNGTPNASPISSVGTPVSLSLKSDSTSNLTVGQQYVMKIYARSDADAANLFVAKVNFPTDKLQVVSIDHTGSFATNWSEEFYDNSAGKISVTGGIPDPGYKTTQDSLLTTIIFTTKAVGIATINMDSGSAIYRNSDNANIIEDKTSALSINIKN